MISIPIQPPGQFLYNSPSQMFRLMARTLIQQYAFYANRSRIHNEIHSHMVNSSDIVGWDIGGAHLKAALVDQSGTVCQVIQQPSPLWQGLEHLDRAVNAVLEVLPLPANQYQHALTMTGELVDLFSNRQEGVAAIIEAMDRHIPADQRSIFTQPDGRFITSFDQSSAESVESIASANWLASAQLCSTVVPSALFVDIGSTTTDILLINNRSVNSRSFSDYERLRSGELIYSGVVRSPVMTLAEQVPYDGEWIGLMAEQFALTADIYRLTGELPLHADQMATADGGKKTVPASAERLARMAGIEPVSVDAMRQVARFLREQQLNRLLSGCHRLLSRERLAPSAPLIGAGVGRFLAESLAGRLGRPYRDFQSLVPHQLGPQEDDRLADCAPAVAVAQLLLHSGAFDRPGDERSKTSLCGQDLSLPDASGFDPSD